MTRIFLKNSDKNAENKGENMGRCKVVMTHREGKHEMTFCINFSTKEEFHKEMKRILEEWIKETGVLNFTKTSITCA